MSDNFSITQIPVKLRNRRPKIIHSDVELDNYVKSTILEWAEKDFTCPYAIQNYVYQTIEPHSMKLYFSQNPNNVRTLKTHYKLVQDINSHILALLSLRPAVTLLDIHKIINILCPNGQQRLLGPLTKNPIIKSFIFEKHDVINPTPDILLSDLIYDCADFVTEKIKVNKKKNESSIVNSLSEEQFLHFLRRKYHVNNSEFLGVKIVNFEALRNAAYVARGESFHKLVASEKIDKLLKIDVKKAIKNIRKKLEASNLCFTEDQSYQSILEYANLPFDKAIETFFQPFLDEEERVLGTHGMNILERNKIQDSLAAVRNTVKLLINDNMHGRLFHLAAIVGSTNKLMSSGFKRQLHHEMDSIKVTNESSEILSSLDNVEWRSRIFSPLFNDITSFYQWFVLHGDNVEIPRNQVFSTVGRILEKCRAIINLSDRNFISYDEKRSIIDSKRFDLHGMAQYCKLLIDLNSSQNWFCNDENFNKFSLDLLPKIYLFIIWFLSNNKLKTLTHNAMESASIWSPTCIINEDLIRCVIQIKLGELTKSGNLKSFDSSDIRNLEKLVYSTLNISRWPLEDTFFSFIHKNQELLYQGHTSESEKGNITEEMNIDQVTGRCQCITLQTEYVQHIMSQLPPSITTDDLVNHVMPLLHGLAITDANMQSIKQFWLDQGQNQNQLLGDDLPASVDIRHLSLLVRHNTAPPKEITKPEHVMREIGSVPLLENVPASMKWNEIYQRYWGDICQFVNEHAALAGTNNVRLLRCQLGIIRVNYTVDQIEIEHNVHQFIEKGDKTHGQRLLGQCVSIMVRCDSLLDLSKLIECIAVNFSSKNHCSELFHAFCTTAFICAPSELMIAIATDLMFPLAKRLFTTDDIQNKQLARVIQSVSMENLALLNIALPKDHYLKPLVTTAMTLNSESQKSQAAIKIQTLQPVHETSTTIANNESDIEDESHLQIDLEVEEISTDDKQKIVDDIRSTEFGLGGELTSSKIVTNFNKKMARLVEHLSSDLYASSSHFILELVQNADDNRYGPQTRPSLNFYWRQFDQQLVLVVKNNETGFTENDLRSLCDIGASTKSDNRSTKIGRKGIGFKSVFHISDSPEVHSNGFHIRFDRFTTGPTGQRLPNNALVPVWCDPFQSTDQLNKGTTIVLPVRSNLCAHIRDAVKSQLQPHLLLFLRNLTRISVHDSQHEQFIELVTDQCRPNRKVVITDSGEKYAWFTHSRQVPVIDYQLQQICPTGLAFTELSIAIPLNQDESHDLPAFAFLPIRSYGLRFIVNADFIIPASREDISTGSPWNQWLIGQLGDLFIHSVLSFIFIDCAISHERVLTILETIPLPGEVPGDSSFHIIVPQLRSGLSQLQWLPDIGDQLHAPSRLIVESEDECGLTEILCSRLNLTLLHKNIATSASDRVHRVLTWLGCRTLSLSHLSQLLAALTPDDYKDRHLIRSIISSIHTGLERDSSLATSRRIAMQLSSLPIWPIVGQDILISLDQSNLPPVFLPPCKLLSSLPVTDRFARLRSVICPTFISSFESANDTENAKKRVNSAKFVLSRLGIHELSSTTVIDRAIIPILSDSTPCRQWLICAAQFLVDQCHPSQYQHNILPLLPLATKLYTTADGCVLPKISSSKELSQVHLPPSLVEQTPNMNIISLFCSKIDYATIDEEYLKETTSDLKHWKDFFLAAGASETFYSITDANGEVTFPQIDSLLELSDKLVNMDLLRYLDHNWSKYPVLHSKGLLSTLTNKPTIPVCTSSSFINQPDQFIQFSPIFSTPCQTLFLSTNDPNKLLLPDSLLVYFPVCPIIFSSASLPRDLSMIGFINVDHISSLLQKVFVTKTICLSSVQSKDLYRWMQHNLSRDALKTVFSNLRTELNGSMMIAVPTGNENDPCELMLDQYCYWTLPISGLSHKHVFLQDQQSMEDLKILFNTTNLDSCCALSKMFPDLESLFVDVMELRQFPTTRDIWPTLEGLLKLIGPDRLGDMNHAEKELITDVYNIIIFLDQHDGGRHRSELLNLQLIPCLKGGYRAFNEISNDFSIFSWRSLETVHSLQRHLTEGHNWPLDFLAVNCFQNSRKDIIGGHNQRWSTAQFLTTYFNLPVLEDSMSYYIDNRVSFQPCSKIKSMLRSVEVIVLEWFRGNAPREYAYCVNMLSSIIEFCSSVDSIYISVTLCNLKDIGYQLIEPVFIGSVVDNCNNTFEILVGSVGSDSLEMSVLANVFDALIVWLLPGDSFNHLRDRFRKFYKNLLEYIESGNHRQISIFFHSHKTRMTSFSIEYLFNNFALNLDLESSPPTSPASSRRSITSLPLNSPTTAVTGDWSQPSSPAVQRAVKRKIITESVNPRSKQMKLDDGSAERANAFRNGSLFIPLSDIDELDSCSNIDYTNSEHEQQLLAPPIFLPKLTTSGANAAQMSGRIGEQLAYDKLLKIQKLGEWDIIRVDWINQNEETRLPYDFKLTARRPDSATTEIIYLEVKATTQSNKRQFDISPQEVSASWGLKETYHLLLVFHSGNYPADDTTTKFVHIPDALGLIQDNQCKLLLDVDQLLEN